MTANVTTKSGVSIRRQQQTGSRCAGRAIVIEYHVSRKSHCSSRLAPEPELAVLARYSGCTGSELFSRRGRERSSERDGF